MPCERGCAPQVTWFQICAASFLLMLTKIIAAWHVHSATRLRTLRCSFMSGRRVIDRVGRSAQRPSRYSLGPAYRILKSTECDECTTACDSMLTHSPIMNLDHFGMTRSLSSRQEVCGLFIRPGTHPARALFYARPIGQ